MNGIQLQMPDLALLKKLLHGEQGFAWWYADLVDAEGNGAVLLWSFGLPFLPGASGSGAAWDRPAVGLSLYREGRPFSYLLNQHEPGSATLPAADGSVCIGRSCFRVETSPARVELRAMLDEPLPPGEGAGVRGELVLSGPRIAVAAATSPAGHLWWPRTFQAEASIALQVGGRSFRVAGSGYFDSNFADRPLSQQGISLWNWGRLSFRAIGREPRTLVYYEVVDTAGARQLTVLEQSGGGELNAVDAELAPLALRRGRYGLRAPRQFSLELPDERVNLLLGAPVDDGPFYQRFLVTATSSSGDAGRGVAEVLAPPKVDRPWQRPFVRMRTHAVGRRNSRWLPLFCGPSEDRLARLLASWRAA